MYAPVSASVSASLCARSSRIAESSAIATSAQKKLDRLSEGRFAAGNYSDITPMRSVPTASG